jgi:hypothetical protein
MQISILTMQIPAIILSSRTRCSIRYFLVFLMVICISPIVHSQTSGTFNLGKCSRLNIGAGYSSYNFNGNKHSPYFIIQHNYCIRPLPHVGFGLGAGIMKYREQTFLPVYFDFLVCHNSNFYGNLQAGYSFGWENIHNYYDDYSFNGGIYSQVGIGYKFELIEEYNSCLFIGYNRQLAGLESNVYADKKLYFNSVVLTLGIMLEKK